jgi:hypothetical protein
LGVQLFGLSLFGHILKDYQLKKTMKNLLVTFICLNITFGAYAQNSSQTNTIYLNWKRYESSNFSIRYPSSWELNLEKKMGETFIIYSPIETSQDKFRENVNLYEENLISTNLSLDHYAQSSINQVRNFINNFILIESKKMKTNTNEYYQLVYKGDQGVLKLIFTQKIWVKGNKAYILTFTSEQNKYSNYKENGVNIFKSFAFKQ